jgi:hypothetical protein
VAELIAGDRHITRDVVSALRVVEPASMQSAVAAPLRQASPGRAVELLMQADVLCNRLDTVITRLTKAGPSNTPSENLAALQQRLADLAKRLNT